VPEKLDRFLTHTVSGSPSTGKISFRGTAPHVRNMNFEIIPIPRILDYIEHATTMDELDLASQNARRFREGGLISSEESQFLRAEIESRTKEIERRPKPTKSPARPAWKAIAVGLQVGHSRRPG
jgi:hypothetical protein